MMTADGKKVECETQITDNYGEFEEEPEVTHPEEDAPSGDSDNNNQSGGTVSRPTYSGGGGGSNVKPLHSVKSE